MVTPELVDEVLAESKRVEKRVRLLPARMVVYFVMGMSLFFHDGYEEVLRRLVGGLRFMGSWDRRWRVPTTGAISQARIRLGAEPMRLLFDRVARPLAKVGTQGAWLRSWRLMAIDGVKINVADTPQNAEVFGRGKTGDPFPQVRVVGLGECGTHAIIDAQVGHCRTGERQMALELLPAMEAGMLVMADRGFHSFDLWTRAMVTGADLLWRVPSNVKLPVGEVLEDGSYASVLVNPKACGVKFRMPLSYVGDPLKADEIPVRVVEYRITDRDGDGKGETIRLITTILDPAKAAAFELAGAYHQRWEYELSLREIEAQILDVDRTLRSKKPDLVRQEVWGLLLTHYAIRALMVDASQTADIDPDRLSFIRSLNLVRRTVTDQAGFSP